MKYLDLLNKLLAFGPKLAVVWPHVLAIIALVRKIAAELAPETADEGSLQVVAPTEAELAAEAAISQTLSDCGSPAVIDFGGIRSLFALLRALPQLVEFLTSALDGIKKLFPSE